MMRDYNFIRIPEEFLEELREHMAIVSEPYKLFLDDIRNPPLISTWVVTKTVAEAKSIIESQGLPEYMSLDHDLGDGPNGLDFIKWLIEWDIENDKIDPNNFNFYVHSKNVPGKENMEGMINSYLVFKLKTHNSCKIL